MLKLNKKIILILCGIMLFSLATFAQTNDAPEMADVMRSNGKIYNVVAVCVTILLGLILYVWSIDRKISRIEKEKNINQ